MAENGISLLYGRVRCEALATDVAECIAEHTGGDPTELHALISRDGDQFISLAENLDPTEAEVLEVRLGELGLHVRRQADLMPGEKPAAPLDLESVERESRPSDSLRSRFFAIDPPYSVLDIGISRLKPISSVLEDWPPRARIQVVASGLDVDEAWDQYRRLHAVTASGYGLVVRDTTPYELYADVFRRTHGESTAFELVQIQVTESGREDIVEQTAPLYGVEFRESKKGFMGKLFGSNKPEPSHPVFRWIAEEFAFEVGEAGAKVQMIEYGGNTRA